MPAILAFLFVGAGPAEAQLLPDAQVVEWECPLMGEEAPPTPPPDPAPGALVADGGFVWYVTRIGQQRLVRFTPGSQLATDAATCDWWDLAPATVTTGGLRLRPAGNVAFIRTFDDMQRIDPVTDLRTRWLDGLFTFSDVATPTSSTVYTTGFTALGLGTPNGGLPSPAQPANDVLQRFSPSSNGSATAKRWEIGGGAGSVFLSGVDVHPSATNLVYFSQPGDNQIGELNTSTNVVRRWSLSSATLPPGVFEPRQLEVSFGGVVWVVTGSGHLVRLNPTTNEVLVATMPGAALNNPFGLDANGVVGFTAAGGIPGFNKVGMLFPDGLTTPVVPTSAVVYAETVTFTNCTVDPTPPCYFPPENVTQFFGPATPVVKTAPATETPDTGGTFYEVMIDLAVPTDFDVCTGEGPDPEFGLETDPCSPSTQPLGVASDPRGEVGSYYAAIGLSVLRIAHVSIPTADAGIVTGGGWITTTAPNPNPLGPPLTGKGTFGLVAMRKHVGDPVKGHVTFQNHLTGDTVISLELTNLLFSGNTATIDGLCKSGSDCTIFSVEVTDNGQPWSNPGDMFEIVRDPLLGLPGTGVVDGGELEGGNLKVRQD